MNEDRVNRLVESADEVLTLLETVMRIHYPNIVIDSRIETLRQRIAEFKGEDYRSTLRYRLTIKTSEVKTCGNYSYQDGMEAWLMALRRFPPPAVIEFEPLIG